MNFRPSYFQGFARGAGESKRPNLWRGLIGAYVPALGVTGGTLFDQSPYKNHGTLTDMTPATDWVIGKNGLWELDFDGSNDYVNLNNASSSNILKPSLPVSILIGFTPGSVGAPSALFMNDSWLGNYRGIVCLMVAAGTIQVGYGDGGTPSSINRRSKTGSTVLVAGTHYNICSIIRGATDMDIYLNVVDNGGSYSGTGGALAYGSGSGSIGSDKGNWITTGGIEYVYVFNREVLLSEISLINTNPLAPFELADRPIGFVPAVAAGGGMARIINLTGALQ